MLIVRKYKYLRRGQLTGFYLFWYGIERFVVEALRADSLMIGSIKIAQIVSIIFVLAGLYFMCIFKYKKEERKDTYYKGKTRYFETDDQEDLYLN